MPRPRKMRHRLRESAPVLDRPAGERLTLTETRSKSTAAPTGATQLVQLIDAGWGSSGYYSTQVLEAAARARTFPKGTHMYWDHPTPTEDQERPERSVRDLAAVLAEDAHYDPQRRSLVARVRVLPHCRELLTSLAEHIGVSIRADGMAEAGEAEGRRGMIVTRIDNCQSADYVTKAGRGGKVLALLESARTELREARNLGAWLESRLHLTLTQLADDMYGDGCLTREERITLSAAIGDGLQAWSARVQADAPQLFHRGPRDQPEPSEQPVTVLEDGGPVETPATVPAASGVKEAASAADNPPHEEEPAMSGTETAGTASVAESAQLQARISVLEAQNATLTVERDTARGELRRIRTVEAARSAVTAALGAVQDLPAPARTRIAESLTVDPPTNDAGEVDTTALTAAVTRAVAAEQEYIASIRESAGVGTPTGLGGSTAPTSAADVPAWQSDIEARFARLGLNESAAAAAARR